MPRRKWLWCGIALALAALYPGLAGDGYPVPGGDSIAFMPAVVSQARGEGLYNPIRYQMEQCDPEGQNRFACHGFLMPLLLPHGMARADAPSLLLAVGWLNAATLLLCAWLFYRAGRRAFAAGQGKAALALSAVALLGQGTRLWGQIGRGELMATPIAVAAVLAAGACRPAFLGGVLGVFAGLMIAAHPIAGLLLILGAALYLADRLALRQALRQLLIGTAAAALTLAAALSFFPYSLSHWLRAIHHQAQAAVVAKWPSSFFWYWFWNPAASFYGLLLLAAAAAAFAYWRRRRPEIAAPALFYPLLLLSAAALFYFVFRVHSRNYNLLLFSPLLYAAVIEGCSGWAAAAPAQRRAWPLLLGALLLLPTAAGFLQKAALYPAYRRQGLKLLPARERFAQALVGWRGRVAIGESLWSLSEDYPRLREWRTPEEDALNRCALVVVQQPYSGRAAPPALPGHRLRADHFRGAGPRLLGIPLASTMPGYGFAVYVPEGSDCRPGAQAALPPKEKGP